jgi:hypothetical protein
MTAIAIATQPTNNARRRATRHDPSTLMHPVALYCVLHGNRSDSARARARDQFGRLRSRGAVSRDEELPLSTNRVITESRRFLN